MTGKTLGVLGGGQLGRMLALAGLPMGVRFRFLDPDPDCPAAEVGELIVGAYDDETALTQLSRGVDAVTYEFENVPAKAAAWLAARAPLAPPEMALAIAQDRLSEKTLFRELGIGTPGFEPVDTREQLAAAVSTLGVPCVLKTRRLGYDGKGQVVLRSIDEIDHAWQELGARLESQGKPAGLIVESFVPFAREISVIGVRSRAGEMRFYPPVVNVHTRGILARSQCPAPGMSEAQRERYEAAASRVIERLDYVGVLTIEFFELADGTILANEMAPRVHNSGHWTIEGAVCSQFENHVRAVLGRPLGSTGLRGMSVMLNVIGEEPDVCALMAIPGVHVHMYGKTPRAGRKIGHVTVCGETAGEVQGMVGRAAGMVRNAL